MRATALSLTLIILLAALPCPLLAQTEQPRIIAALDEIYPPHEYYDRGVARGFNVDILEACARTLNVKVIWVPLPWEKAYDAVRRGEADVIFVSSKPERQRDILFTHETILDLALDIFVRKQTYGIASLQDLADRTVSVEKDDISEIELRRRVPKAIIITEPSQTGAMELLARGDVTAFFGNYYTGLYLIQRYAYDDLKIIGERLDIPPRVIGVTKSKPALRDQLDSALRSLKASGEYQRIKDRWFGRIVRGGVPWKKLLLIPSAVVAAIVLALIILLLINRQLRREVARRTAEVRVREENLRAILDAAEHLAFITLNPETNTLLTCLGCDRMFGYSTEELVGRNVSALLAPQPALPRPETPTGSGSADRDEMSLLHALREVTRTKTPQRAELALKRKNDEPFPAELMLYPLVAPPVRTGGGGAVTSVLVVAQDITAKKRIDAERAALARLFRRLAEARTLEEVGSVTREETEALFAWDAFFLNYRAPGEHVLHPLAFCDTFNGEKRQVPGPASDLASLATLPGLLEGRPVLINRSQPVGDAAPHLVRFGDENSISASLVFVPIQLHEQIIGILSVQSYARDRYSQADADLLQRFADALAPALQRVEDAARGAEAEAALRLSEERYRTLVQNAAEGIAIVDADEIYRFVNPAHAQQLGYTPEELLGKSVLDLCDEEGREKLRQETTLRMRGIASRYAIRLRHKSGSWRILTIHASPFYHRDGTFIGTLGLLEDITERIELEEQLRQSQKLEAIGRLAGGIAHDFNNFITAITGYADLLLLSPATPEAARHAIEEIRKAAGRAASLTHQILAFGRQQVLKPTVENLNGIITGMSGFLERILGEKSTLAWKPAPDLRNATLDHSQIEQVVMNLVSNARDAMPDGGNVTIETANVRLPLSTAGDEQDAAPFVDIPPGNYVVLSVSDTGSGMTDEVKKHVFEPFFTTKEERTAMGLGLATVYGIVKQHGGHIFVQSEVGKGSTFTIYMPAVSEPSSAQLGLPAQAGAEEFAKPYAQGGLPRGTETILIVEDDTAIRELAALVLSNCGYKVLQAGNAEEALRDFASRSKIMPHRLPAIDLLLTDLILPPPMRGADLAQKLRKLQPRLKVLYISGYADIGALAESTPLLQKPFGPAQLAQTVRHTLDS